MLVKSHLPIAKQSKASRPESKIKSLKAQFADTCMDLTTGRAAWFCWEFTRALQQSMGQKYPEKAAEC